MTHHFTRFLLVFFCFVFALATSAEAANCPTKTIPRPNKNAGLFEIGNCANSYTGFAYQDYEFTTKLVDCIEGTIRNAVIRMMTVIAQEFGWVAAVLSTLVIIFYGIRNITGERDLLKRTSTLFIKLAFVTLFLNTATFLVVVHLQLVPILTF